MNPWPFVIGSYALTFIGTVGLVWASLSSMRRAEREADKLRDGR